MIRIPHRKSKKAGITALIAASSPPEKAPYASRLLMVRKLTNSPKRGAAKKKVIKASKLPIPMRIIPNIFFISCNP